MKKPLLGLLALAGLAVVAVLGLSQARPDLLPAWANLGAFGGASADSGLYCKEHGVPEKFCTLCHEELKKTLLLCKEHGDVPEDICTLCHPEVEKQHNIEMCPRGHKLPKHFCYKCAAETGGVEGSGHASAGEIDDGWCAEFGEVGLDGQKTCKLLPLVRLATAGLAADVGLKTTLVAEEDHIHELTANAETAYDANRYAEISPRVSGFLREARLDLGGKAESGEVVAVVDSAEASTAKAQYIAAHSAYELTQDAYRRTSALAASEVIADKQVIADRSAMNQAQASLLNAEQKLRNLRFDDADLARILTDNDAKPFLDVTTPVGGTVVFRHAVLGEAVEPTTKLYTVADTSNVWLWIDLYEQDVADVAVGREVSFTVMGGSREETPRAFKGKITWIGSEVDQTTRTTKVRAELPNPHGLLRANQFGKAQIEVDDNHTAVTVDKRAVQRFENVDLVFLVESPGVYRPQRIKTKAVGRADVLEVVWGVKPGQEIVTDGSFLLKTEILKGSIGAGCCE